MNIVTIFAGRRPNLDILLIYLKAALELCIIHEVHLWNYARQPEDELFIKAACDINKKFHFMETTDKTTWKYYYYHYCDDKYKNDIIIKCDDDIVFIDLFKLPNFIEFIKNNDYNLVFANIINNGVAAYYQQNRYNLIPTELLDLEYPNCGMCGTLWDSGIKAEILHNYFINNYNTFLQNNHNNEVIQINTRFSINFFGYKGKYWHTIKDCWTDDEHLLTTDYVLNRGFKNVLYTNFYVSHLSFYRQIETGINLDDLRQKYNILELFSIDKVYNQL